MDTSLHISYTTNNKEINKITRESIQHALIKLLENKSFHDISVTELVHKAGVSRSAYYKNYSSKCEVLLDFAHSIFINNHLMIDQHTFIPTVWFSKLLSQIKENLPLFKVLIKSDVKGYVQFINKEKIQSLSTLERLHLQAIRGGLQGVIVEWIENDAIIPVEDVVSLVEAAFPTIKELLPKLI